MTSVQRQQHLDRLKAALEEPDGRQATRYFLAACGSIPAVGGAISGAAALSAERDQQFANQMLLGWAQLADRQLEELVATIEDLLKSPSRASMFFLLNELLGSSVASSLMTGELTASRVILGQTSTAELEPFIARQWLSISPTGAMCSMGAGNRVGDHIEERKRPYGMGTGFTLSVTELGRDVSCT